MALDWDDFRFAKTVADRGGLTAAATELGINHSTAFRRLAALEARLGTRLFERLRTGYVPTAAGQAMIDAAGRIEADVTRFARVVAGQGETPSGELRVTAPAGFAAELLMPMLASFAERYPEIRIDLILAEATLNLSRRDADVAIRISREPSETLVGRRLALTAWGSTAAPTAPTVIWPARRGSVRAALVAGGSLTRFVEARVPSDRVRLRINAVLGLEAAVEAGLGIGPLPCFTADLNPALRRLSGPHPELGADLWILTHPDLRHAARVRAFMEHVAEALLPLRARFEGR